MKKIADDVYMLGNPAGVCSNVYVLGKGEKLFIDSGNGSLSFDFEPSVCILTHGHSDHVGGVKEDWKKVYLHEKDMGFVSGKNIKKLDFGKMTFGDFDLFIIHTPGHTLGSVCIFERKRKILFSGDTLFAGGAVGRTDIGGDAILLKKSLEKIKNIRYELLCPGHGEVEKTA
jgi:glyoxylase-like metal-dependent hydrolase (beta-lactamase superfamily II)